MPRDYLRKHLRMWGSENNPTPLHAQNGRGWREHGRTRLWFVYTMYESQARIDVPLYVGMTSHLHQRISQHRTQQDWWPLVGLIVAETFVEKDDAEHAEHMRIRSMRPLFNLAWNRHTPDMEVCKHGVVML